MANANIHRPATRTTLFVGSATSVISTHTSNAKFTHFFPSQQTHQTQKFTLYTLPTIQDVIRHHFRDKFLTKLDLDMCFYTNALDNKSPPKNLCTICTLHGNYHYKVAPMGVKQSPDFAQDIIEELPALRHRRTAFLDRCSLLSSRQLSSSITLPPLTAQINPKQPGRTPDCPQALCKPF